MSNGIYLTLEQYKDKDLPITIMINGNTYHSQFALATTQTTWFEMGKQHGMELGADNTYSDKEMSRMHDAWYDEGYAAGRRDQFNDDGELFEKANARNVNLIDEVREKSRKLGYDEGYEAGKKEATLERVDQFNKGYEIGKYEGYEAGKKYIWFTADEIKQLHTDNEYTRKIWSEKGKAEGYGEGYNDGYEQCKHDGISKINLNTEPVEQTELSKEYDKGFTKGYEEGFEEGKSEGYEIGKKANGISKKEIPGEYLSHIEEARKQGYADGYKDCREVANCREVAKMLNKYGIDEDGPCNDCKEEPGRDDDEPIGPEQTEYAKGYEDGRMDIMQFIGNNRG